jgi:hypothetical protein
MAGSDKFPKGPLHEQPADADGVHRNNMKNRTILSALLVAAVAAPAAWAQLLDIDIRLGRHAPPPPPAVVVVAADPGPGGPVPWEHGHWYRRSQGYYYYPGGGVYYRPADHVWFYLERGQWRSGRNLPDSVSVDFSRSVSLTMGTDRPYEFQRQVVARYPSNYFGTKVRLRDEVGRDRGKDDHRMDNRGKDDRGKNDHDRGQKSDHDGGDRSKDRDDQK